MRIGVTVPLTRPHDDAPLPTWPEIRAYIEHAEALGFHSVWVFDHLYSGHGDVPPSGIHEAWSVQTALAAVTTRVELGQLVTCTTFRHPGVLAKQATTVDSISGGRLMLGLGAGWYDREYQDFGFPTDHRASRFAEAIDIILPLLQGVTVTEHGRFHHVDGARLLPPPARRIPILIAGERPRMRGLVAQHADAWNTAWYTAPNERLTESMDAMKATLDEHGRDHSTLRWTVGVVAAVKDVATLASTIKAFDGRGIDDLILSIRPANPAALDILAEAAGAHLA